MGYSQKHSVITRKLPAYGAAAIMHVGQAVPDNSARRPQSTLSYHFDFVRHSLTYIECLPGI